jgi:hypothetical protein
LQLTKAEAMQIELKLQEKTKKSTIGTNGSTNGNSNVKTFFFYMPILFIEFEELSFASLSLSIAISSLIGLMSQRLKFHETFLYVMVWFMTL